MAKTNVTLTVGKTTVKVEFPDEASAQRAFDTLSVKLTNRGGFAMAQAEANAQREANKEAK